MLICPTILIAALLTLWLGHKKGVAPVERVGVSDVGVWWPESLESDSFS